MCGCVVHASDDNHYCGMFFCFLRRPAVSFHSISAWPGHVCALCTIREMVASLRLCFSKFIRFTIRRRMFGCSLAVVDFAICILPTAWTTRARACAPSPQCSWTATVPARQNTKYLYMTEADATMADSNSERICHRQLLHDDACRMLVYQTCSIESQNFSATSSTK